MKLITLNPNCSVNKYVFPTLNQSVNFHHIKYIAVLQAQEPCCNTSSGMLIIEADRGYLSSSVTAKTGCGSTACPWQIYAPSGQKIDIFLWDFQYGKLHQGTAVMKYFYFHKNYINDNDNINSNNENNKWL